MNDLFNPGGPVLPSRTVLSDRADWLSGPGLYSCTECDVEGRAWPDPWGHTSFHAKQARTLAAEKVGRNSRVPTALAAVSLALSVLALIFVVIS